jgi:hypothetical protein
VARHDIVIGSIAVGASATGAVAFLSDPSGVPTSSALLIATGMLVVTLAGLSGLLLARAPWGRWTLVATTVGSMALASVGSTPLTWVVLAVGAIALVGLLGPWLRLWTRHARVADAPNAVVIALLAAGPVAPLYVGVCTWATPARWPQWTAALATLVSAAIYGRGVVAGIWLLRLGVPIVGAIAALATGGAGGAAIGIGAAAVAVLAWSPRARKATRVLAPVLPDPVRRGG